MLVTLTHNPGTHWGIDFASRSGAEWANAAMVGGRWSAEAARPEQHVSVIEPAYPGYNRHAASLSQCVEPSLANNAIRLFLSVPSTRSTIWRSLRMLSCLPKSEVAASS